MSDFILTNSFAHEPNLQAWARAGSVFTGTTDRQLTTAGNVPGSAIWFNAVAKNVLLFSAVVGLNNNVIVGNMRAVTSNPALASTMTVSNMNLGSAVTSLVTAATFATTGVTAAGTVLEAFSTTNPGQADILAYLPGRVVFIPAGTAAGVAIFPTLGADGFWFTNYTWVEF